MEEQELLEEQLNTVDQSIFKQAAIWGCVYQVQKDGGSLDQYERDEETGCMILPQLEVDAYLTNLLGPDYQIQEGSFQTSEMNYVYSEEKQGYLVPVTGSVGLYTPDVESISTSGGKMYVTVGEKVIYSKYAGTEVKLDGEEYIIVRQSDILAIVE